MNPDQDSTRAWVQDDGDAYPIDLADLDIAVRRGQIAADVPIRHAPWTGDAFVPIHAVPALQEALDAPDARFSAYLRQRHPAWLTGTVAVMVMGAALTQVTLTSLAHPWAVERVSQTFQRWTVGLEPTLLDGRWWTLWASQLSHGDLFHALFNVPIIAYCGYRVEQALAPSGALTVMAAALLCGSLAIIGLDSVPVMGSSIIAYGLWAAQIAIGFRKHAVIPPTLRGRYGMGNFIFFAPLYAASLSNTAVSHLGHTGGLVGGALVALLLTPESMASPAQRPRVRARVLSVLCGLSAAPLLLLALAARSPGTAYGPYEEVSVPRTGAMLTLPRRMVAHPVNVGGLQGWRPSQNGNEPLFVDLVFLPEGPVSVPAWWGRLLNGEAKTLPAPPALGPDWISASVQVGGWTVVEHQLVRGHWLLRAGYVTRAPASALAGRRALYADILQTLTVSEIPALSTARVRWESTPFEVSNVEEYARQLRYAGQPAVAEAVLAPIQPAGLEERITLWMAYPAVEPEDADRLVLTGAPSPRLQALVLEWLVASGRCAAAAGTVLPEPSLLRRCPVSEQR